MKLLTSVLAAAMSLPLWANEPAAPVAPAAPAEPAAPAVAQPAPVAVSAPTANTAVALPPEVKEEIILNNPANLQALKTLLGPELTQAGAAQAAQQQANGRAGAVTRVATQSPAQTAAMTAGRQQVQVRPGETLDRILARTLGSTPFAPALVRKTVVDMNPTAFAGGSPHRLNAGATLVLPSMQDLQAVAGGGSTGAALLHSPAGGGGHAQSQDDRRHWIRYP